MISAGRSYRLPSIWASSKSPENFIEKLHRDRIAGEQLPEATSSGRIADRTRAKRVSERVSGVLTESFGRKTFEPDLSTTLKGRAHLVSELIINLDLTV